MTVAGAELVDLVEEYFELEEDEEGKPLEETRSLKEIVIYLKKRCGEQELGEISTSSGRGLEDKKKRNINDRVRRVLKKMPSISSTTGKTTKKRYYRIEGEDPNTLYNRFYREIFILNEIIAGGHLKAEKFPNILPPLESTSTLLNFLWGPPPELEENNLFDMLYILSATEFRTKFLETVPFKLNIDDNSLKNDSTRWFTHEPAWMEKKYYGFLGPDGLDDVLGNISKNIQENDTSKISRILKIEPEDVKWLKRQYSSRHNRMPNLTIFTLALLHLNRSLLESIDL